MNRSIGNRKQNNETDDETARLQNVVETIGMFRPCELIHREQKQKQRCWQLRRRNIVKINPTDPSTCVYPPETTNDDKAALVSALALVLALALALALHWHWH